MIFGESDRRVIYAGQRKLGSERIFVLGAAESGHDRLAERPAMGELCVARPGRLAPIVAIIDVVGDDVPITARRPSLFGDRGTDAGDNNESGFRVV